MNARCTLLAKSLVTLLTFTSVSQAAIWTDEGVSHEYKVISAPNTSWDAAVAWTKTNLGQAWHLATITSEREQAFIDASVLNGVVGEYLAGGYQDPQSSAPRANWHWVTGEPWSYTNWWFGEPNDNYGPGSESYLGVNFEGCCWNDEGKLDEPVGFVAERTFIPEPSTIFLIGAGLLGLAMLRLPGGRRRRST